MANERQTGKLRVFISYSRADEAFADELRLGLEDKGYTVEIDKHSIRQGEEWKARLGKLIAACDTVVFVLSPDSARSSICHWEVEEAHAQGKRIVPVLHRGLHERPKGTQQDSTPWPEGSAKAPERLALLNYPRFDEGRSFMAGLRGLVEALEADHEWIEAHSRLATRARDWDDGGRPTNRLMSGPDIVAAKRLVETRKSSAPSMLPVQLDFIQASEVEETARQSAERQRLEQMAAAQLDRELALKDKEVAQQREADAARRVVQRTRVGLFAALLLAGVAVCAGLFAFSERMVALQHEAKAKDRLHKAINTAREFATQTVSVADRHEIAPDTVINLLRPAERTLLQLVDQQETDPALHVTIAMTTIDFARSYRLIGKREDWRTRVEAATGRLREQMKLFPAHVDTRSALVTALLETAEIHRDAGNPTAAIAQLTEVSEMLQRLAAELPREAALKRELATTYIAVGQAARLMDNFQIAREHFVKALDLRREIVTLDAGSAGSRLALSEVHVDLGMVHHEHQDNDQAQANYRIARDIREELVANDGNNPSHRRLLSWILSTESELLQENGQHDAAIQLQKRMMDLRRRNADAVPTNLTFRRDLAWAHFTIAEGCRIIERNAEAESEMNKAALIFDELLAANPRDPGDQRRAGWAHRHIGLLRTHAGNLPAARQNLARAEELLRAATERLPDNLHWRFEYGLTMSDLGFWNMQIGDLTAARSDYKRAMEVLDEVPERRLVRSNNREARAALKLRWEEFIAAERTASSVQRFSPSISDALGQHEAPPRQ